MIPLHHLQDRKIAVLGLSRTGEAVVAAALAGGAARVEVWDDNPDSLHATLAAFPAAQAGVSPKRVSTRITMRW